MLDESKRLPIEPRQREMILEKLARIPAVAGKIIVTIEFNCGMAGNVNGLTMKHWSEEKLL